MEGMTNRPSGATVGMRSLEEALSEVERELQVRKRCYQRWVDDGKLSIVEARDRFDRLAAARDYLRQAMDSTVQESPVNAENGHAVVASVVPDQLWPSEAKVCA